MPTVVADHHAPSPAPPADLHEDGLRDVRVARAWLSRAFSAGDPALHAFLGDVDPVAAVRAIRARSAPTTVLDAYAANRNHAPNARPGHATAYGKADRRVPIDKSATTDDWAAADLTSADMLGLRLAIPEDSDWPASLLMLPAAVAPPVALWVRGRLPLDVATAGAVAIVGARRATGYGHRVAADLAHELAATGRPIIAAGGHGVAHAVLLGALRGNSEPADANGAIAGAAIAVLAGGLVGPWPTALTRLYQRVAQPGLVLSEWPPHCPPQRHHFAARNRLLALLATATVIIEATGDSPATAATGTKVGRPVMAVPGPVTTRQSLGTHALIQQDTAVLVSGAADVLDIIDGDERRRI